MYAFIRRVLFLLPPETAHTFTMGVLALLSHLTGVCRWLRRRMLPAPGAAVELSVDVAGVRWSNPVGLAAGLDKDAHAVSGLFALGFGAVEVGTLTPRPQPGNPRPRLFRLPEHRALINRLGFNNRGASAAAERLKARTWHPGPVGVNLGKNKDTPLADAVSDYVACVDQLAALGDYVVVNASSPNTPNLRQLQEPEALTALLQAVQARIQQVAPGKPLFLKIAPDLALEAVDAVVDVALACGIQGLIATNTTITRPVEHPLTREQGGLSGAPLKPLADAVLARAAQRAAGRLTLIGVGGVFSAEDAYAKIRAGASAVQLYTGFVYGGPAAVRHIVTGLAALLARDGFRSVQEAVGADLPRRTAAPATGR